MRYESNRRPPVWPWLFGGFACALLAMAIAWGLDYAHMQGWWWTR